MEENQIDIRDLIKKKTGVVSRTVPKLQNATLLIEVPTVERMLQISKAYPDAKLKAVCVFELAKGTDGNPLYHSVQEVMDEDWAVFDAIDDVVAPLVRLNVEEAAKK